MTTRGYSSTVNRLFQYYSIWSGQYATVVPPGFGTSATCLTGTTTKLYLHCLSTYVNGQLILGVHVQCSSLEVSI